MASSLVNDVRMMVWSARQAQGRRRNTSNYHEGQLPCSPEFLALLKSCPSRMFAYFPGRSYAEVLENTQLSLIATIHKLYAMVRSGQPWELGEPQLNHRGEPVIHNIAQRLGCIRPQNDVDLPISHIFPEDEAGLSKLAIALERHHKERESGSGSATCPPSPTDNLLQNHHQQSSPRTTAVSSPRFIHHHESDHQSSNEHQRRDRASSSELEYSDLDTDYRKAVFCRMNASAQLAKGTPPSCPSPSTTMSPSACSSVLAPTLSPQTLSYDVDVSPACSDLESAGPMAGAPPPVFPASAPPVLASYADPAVSVTSARPPSTQFTPEQVIRLTAGASSCGGAADAAPAPVMIDVDDIVSQSLLETDFASLKPHVLNCPNPQVMMGVGDPMIFGGGIFEPESLNM